MENTTLIQHRNTDLNPTRYNPAQLHWICIGFTLCDRLQLDEIPMMSSGKPLKYSDVYHQVH